MKDTFAAFINPMLLISYTFCTVIEQTMHSVLKININLV